MSNSGPLLISKSRTTKKMDIEENMFGWVDYALFIEILHDVKNECVSF